MNTQNAHRPHVSDAHLQTMYPAQPAKLRLRQHSADRTNCNRLSVLVAILVAVLTVLLAVLIAVFGVAVLAVSLVIVLVHVVIIFAIVCHDKALLI